ncbi:MAG: extracellular solute-binding protein [Lachnospiraceae bacterium]|nr:extracellular solute-binding protein [Lachnospiraceae bacterium]MDE7331400.1 extracellular solute-binding protein [Lachnospiraceae bacterium]
MSFKLKRIKEKLALLMLFVMMICSLAGCGNNQKGSIETDDGKEETLDNVQSDVPEEESSDDSEKNTAMGRYVESSMDLSEYCLNTLELKKMPDGNIFIADSFNGKIVSKDNGITWETQKEEWLSDLKEKEAYIMSVSYGADGTTGILYNVHENQDESGEENQEDNKLHPVGLIVRPDGTQISFDIPITEDENFMRKIWISGSGRVFVTTLGETIYEVKEDGSSEKFLKANGRPELINFQDNIMIIDGSHFEGLALYDMEKKEYVEDEVLNAFINENYKDRSYDTADCYEVYSFPGEEGVIYIAGKKGLHRHVIGGSAVEQIIDGNLSCFSNPSYLLKGMVMLPDNEFIALFVGGKLVRFTYNPDIPTVPNEKLKVYSLKENDTLKQAVTIYQSNNPEVYLEYEVGISSESVTKDDALKKLNTQIMAGQGPDLLILDEMPVDSYIEKGFLLDLSDCLASMESKDKPFENIISAFKKDNSVYMIPCEIQIPIIEGKEKYVSKADDLEGIADMIEEIRQETPQADILDVCSEKGIMRLFSMVSAPAWKKESGELDKETLKDFLQQTKRIYDAQMDGISEKSVEEYESRSQNIYAYTGVKLEDSDYLMMVNSLDIVAKYVQIECGTLYYRGDLTQAFSVSRIKEFEDDMVVPMNGHSKNVFVPKTLIGINAASEETERAKDMLKVLLGRDNQSSLYKGFSVTEAGFEEMFKIEESYINDEGIYSYIGSSGRDGIGVDMAIYWFTDEQKQLTKDWIHGLSTAYIPDTVLENAVYEEGESYIRGDKSLDEAVNAIEQKVSIYMSE